ncbi:UvrD-helicase domain-containing protein [Haladaptatus cibarius]|uniref:UvrD-helicase domain-containing protein n=1 Tax=Haladaptatus cibarius TaxID=453847 RepID=UPI0006787FE5|nr:ATP-dependent DNA helicase [Haladaptatus cibarius]
MTNPNDQQQTLIDSTDGIYRVDAGAGTGKTFTITRRYANIVSQTGVSPDDVLLVTFTNNAATEMKERVVEHCNYEMRELADAPIGTFHSLCHDIIQEHGFDAPELLGIDDHITASTRILGEEIVEEAHFSEFIDRFTDDHPEHAEFVRIVRDTSELLGLIHQLSAKGVFPTEDGWYRNSERSLDGEFDAFREIFDSVNEQRGRKQSRLRKKLGRYGRGKCYLPDAPEKSELRGGRGTKQIDESVAKRVFDTDREALKEFVHDVYFEYVRFALRRNYLNFGFLQLFAFVLLCEDDDLREECKYEYVMVDEFQDSSEIQFKLALLLAGTDNFCVVGDWKQSIYSFQYAEVANITEFESRLERFADELNDDGERVGVSTADVNDIALVENYRSTQAILDFSEHSLTTEAAKSDDVDPGIAEEIVPLSSNTEHEYSRIEAVVSDDEHESVLETIQQVVGNEEYAIERDGELLAPRHEDIAVLTRTRDFGRELQDVADEYGIPMAYEGGVELFRTDPAKLLLAWLRILETDSNRGWAVVLEQAGYSLDEVQHVLETGEYPTDMADFRAEIEDMETVGAVARTVFSRYGYDGTDADVLLSTLQSVFDATTMTRGDLIRFVERGIERGTTQEVADGIGSDSVTVQTIHAAKGLEHPIVILANMNEGRFPTRGSDTRAITYGDPVGLRQRKRYAEAHGRPHIYDDWQTDVLRHCLPKNYDEERRLLYVAMTRAESHLVFSAGESPSPLFENLPIDAWERTPDLSVDESVRTEQTKLRISTPDPEGPRGHTPHTLMRDDVFEDREGRGTDFGARLHGFAERYARDEPVEPKSDDQRRVAEFIDSMDGEKIIEENAYLPLTVDGEQVTISGIVDLIHVTPDSVEIVDYKTDLRRDAQSEYEIQLSIYYHVVSAAYPDHEVSAKIFYTALDDALEPSELPEINRLSKAELAELVRERTA